MMKVMTRHLTREVLVASLFILFALTALFAFFDLVRQLGNIGTRYSLLQAVTMTMLNLPTRIYEVMPVAALVGAVYTLSRWAANSEFTILRVSGLSPLKLAGMLSVSGIVLSLAAYGLGEFVAPTTYKLRDQMQLETVNGAMTAYGYDSGIWLRDVVRNAAGEAQTTRFVNVRSLVNGERGAKTGAWRVFEFNADRELTRIIHAAGADYVRGEGWHLKNAVVEQLPKVAKDETPMIDKATVRRHSDMMLATDLRPDLLGVLTIRPERMGIADLWLYVDYLKENKQTSERYETALWKRVFYPLAIFVMLAVSMPFAYLNARSGGVSIKIFVGLMIGITFYALNNIFSFLSVINTWSPVLMSVLPSLIMMSLAAVAMWWVERR